MVSVPAENFIQETYCLPRYLFSGNYIGEECDDECEL